MRKDKKVKITLLRDRKEKKLRKVRKVKVIRVRREMKVIKENHPLKRGIKEK